ncbi:uncharacterized protein ACLA_062040 [Aspergillus clavatus NRRL 1]|uniref:Uncharacterized protein n=1 Tax=Aspergillus clavatus (strain ATCC 1007 / CBS 513.65 / DSM 816 / NCTC 3887 / NRRL 1 / QM 1276 / 107) TaxID=344612 RepID=A1CCI4_ASPCL|nr:uncharacterized protein ACLA_062040 [Aspergillus clavatus NRRL 1]EAW12241.1 conserved hypothetical protein [Aspergillus clavatus NRRL 1]
MSSYSLPPETKCYQYTGTTDYTNTLRDEQARFKDNATRTTSQYIVFDIDERTYAHDICESNTNRLSELVVSYSPFERLALVKITTAAQQQAHMGIASKMIQALTGMDKANHSLHMIGSAQIRTPSRSKRADQEFQPRKLPPGRERKWPTLVVEAGYSNSKPKLESDVAWWFEESGGEVKTALVIAIDRPRRMIIIEKWESTDQTKPPTVQQQVIILRNEVETANITNAPLVLSYKNLFLKLPGEYESNIDFTEKDLQNIAEKIWQVEEI